MSTVPTGGGPPHFAITSANHLTGKNNEGTVIGGHFYSGSDDGRSYQTNRFLGAAEGMTESRQSSSTIYTMKECRLQIRNARSRQVQYQNILSHCLVAVCIVRSMSQRTPIVYAKEEANSLESSAGAYYSRQEDLDCLSGVKLRDGQWASGVDS